jgi:hypothetical protein
MFTKISKGTQLFEKLNSLMDKGQQYDFDSIKFAEDIGGKSPRYEHGKLYGGISTIVFDGKPPKGWVKAGPKYEPNEYMPGKTIAGKQWQKTIDAMPCVTNNEFNSIIGYDWTLHTTNKVRWVPCIHPHEDYILLDFADHTPYTPLPEMEEITVTEFKRLDKPEPVNQG